MQPLTPPSAASARRIRAARLTQRLARGAIGLLPAVLLAAASLFAGLHAIGFAPRLLSSVPALLPIDPDLSQRLTAAASAVGLTGIAVGLARHKQAAWWVAVVTLGAALPVQAGALRHGVGALFATVCLAVLIADRRRYRVETAGRSRRVALVLWIVGSITVMTVIGLTVGASLRLVGLPMDARDAGGGMLLWAAFGDPRIAFPAWREPGLLLGATLAARVAIVIGIVAALAPGDAPRDEGEDGAHATAIASRYGQGALLPFQLGPETRRFSLPDREGVLAYGRDGRVAVILGDPIGPEHEAVDVLRAFLLDCEHHDWWPAVYQASAAGLPPLTAAGFVAYRIGLEAVLDLAGFDLAGSRRANLRHTVTRATRGGITVSWYPDGLGVGAGTLASELEAVDAAWRCARRIPLHFTVSAYQPADLVANPVAVAQDARGAVVAFTTFRPTGADGGWVLDLLRRVTDSAPGAVESCLAAAATGLRQRGAKSLSLGLAPLAGLDSRHGALVERGLAIGARIIRPAYDVDGLAFFKGKFAPRWEPRYLAVRHRRHLPGVLLALLRLHLGGSRALLRSGLQLRPSAAR
jgi:phosphatidylglycerol lysyltransferase